MTSQGTTIFPAQRRYSNRLEGIWSDPFEVQKGRQRVRLALMAAALASASVPQLVNSETYRLDVSGHATSVSSSLSKNFVVGQAASATVTFDFSSAGFQAYPTDPSIYYYPNAALSGGLQTSGYNASFLSGNETFVTNDEGGTIDRFIYEDASPTGNPEAGLPPRDFFINFQAGTSTLSSTALSDIPSRLALFGSATAALDFGTNDGTNRVQFTFDNVTLTAVPEATTWLMLCVGLGMAGATLRKRKAAVSSWDDKSIAGY